MLLKKPEGPISPCFQYSILATVGRLEPEAVPGPLQALSRRLLNK